MSLAQIKNLQRRLQPWRQERWRLNRLLAAMNSADCCFDAFEFPCHVPDRRSRAN